MTNLTFDDVLILNKIKDSYGRDIFILKCSESNCNKQIRIRKDNKHSGKCRSCSKHKEPFRSHYQNLFHDFRKIPILLTYNEFLEFTKIKTCHYCNTSIPWQPYTIGNKKCTAYFLDRKDNDGPYSKNNCVVCCTRCNRMRSNKFTYEEFCKFKPILIEIMENRK